VELCRKERFGKAAAQQSRNQKTAESDGGTEPQKYREVRKEEPSRISRMARIEKGKIKSSDVEPGKTSRNTDTWGKEKAK
jgi:hypothetical protein